MTKYAAKRAYLTEGFSVALSPRDKGMLGSLANTAGQSRAETVRDLIRREARRLGVWPPADDIGAAQEARRWPI